MGSWVQKSLLAFTFTTALRAAAADVTISPMVLYVPLGFDDNDEITAVVEGLLPDPCHKLRAPEVTPVGDRLEIRIKASLEKGWCPDVPVPFTQVVPLGVLRPGNYRVTAGKDLNEPLPVAAAKAPTKDDHFYAPIDAARVFVSNRVRVVLEGRFTNTCLRIKEVRALPLHRKTFVLLPIAEMTERDPDGNRCKFKMISFNEKVELPPVVGGRYLIHVRTMNGQALNEVFTTTWN